MAAATDFVAKGKVLRADGNRVVFAPAGTNYELHLEGSYDGPLNVPVSARIRAKGRKLMTVPSGGNFVAPIQGTPRTFQGRVRYADESQVVIHAGVPVLIELPTEEDALDLADGAVTVGEMLNAIVYPGVSFELVPEAVSA